MFKTKIHSYGGELNFFILILVSVLGRMLLYKLKKHSAHRTFLTKNRLGPGHYDLFFIFELLFIPDALYDLLLYSVYT